MYVIGCVIRQDGVEFITLPPENGRVVRKLGLLIFVLC